MGIGNSPKEDPVEYDGGSVVKQALSFDDDREPFIDGHVLKNREYRNRVGCSHNRTEDQCNQNWNTKGPMQRKTGDQSCR